MHGLRCRPGGESITALEDELLELGDVELRRENPQHVARRRGDKATRWKHSSQPRDRRLKGVRCARRGVLAPQLDQKLLAGHDLVGVQHQVGKHGTLPDAADRDPAAAVLEMERAEDPYPHPSASPWDVSGLSAPNVHCRTMQQGIQASGFGTRKSAVPTSGAPKFTRRLRFRG